jgi:hypothetical protein
VVELAWIAVVAEKPGQLELVPHPDPQMASRVVSQSPRRQVPIAAMGRIGFGEDGFAPTPSLPGPELGAACIADTLCFMLTESEAAYYRSLGKEVIFLGEGISCRTEAHCLDGAPLGACCLPDGSCRVTTRKECVKLEGRYLGEGSQCEPDSCRSAGGAGVPVGGGSEER